MAETSSWRSQPKPPGWKTTRIRILARDRHLCQWRLNQGICGAPANEVDHITPAWRGGSDEDANLRSLCTGHHKRKSAGEGGQAAQAKRIPRNRPREAHPGLIAT